MEKDKRRHDPATGKGRPGETDRKRAAFAAAMARAEFGRFYWSQSQEAELRGATKQPPKRK